MAVLGALEAMREWSRPVSTSPADSFPNRLSNHSDGIITDYERSCWPLHGFDRHLPRLTCGERYSRSSKRYFIGVSIRDGLEWGGDVIWMLGWSGRVLGEAVYPRRESPLTSRARRATRID